MGRWSVLCAVTGALLVLPGLASSQPIHGRPAPLDAAAAIKVGEQYVRAFAAKGAFRVQGCTVEESRRVYGERYRYFAVGALGDPHGVVRVSGRLVAHADTMWTVRISAQDAEGSAVDVLHVFDGRGHPPHVC
jgi:hypothetical protein